MINEKIDLKKCKNIYDIIGCHFWQYGWHYVNYLRWAYEGKTHYIINTVTGEKIKGFAKIKKYIKINNLELERF